MLEAHLALKFLKAPKSLTLSFFTLVAVLGIVVSVTSLLVIHSVMNGFGNHLKKTLIGFQAHLLVDSLNADHEAILKEIRSKVNEAQAGLTLHGILKSPEGTTGVILRGLSQEIIEKTFEILPLKEGPGIYLGEELYHHLFLVPGLYEEVTFINPFFDVGPTGEFEPLEKTFPVAGIIKTGFYEYDRQYAFLDLPMAAPLSNSPTFQIQIRIADENLAPHVKAELLATHPELHMTTWMERNKRIFQALKLERLGMAILLGLVILIAGMNILSLMNLVGLGRQRDFALLYSLGLSPIAIKRVVGFMGLYLGVLGAIMGLILGGLTLWWLHHYPIALPSAYYVEVLPVQVSPFLVVAIFLLTPLITMMAGLYPHLTVKPMEYFRAT